MIVLSLFDGMSCAQLALKRAGVQVDKYFASEVCPDAIKIAQRHFPDTVQLGDVRDLKGSDFPKIDLLIGGSPCTSFSRGASSVNQRTGFDGASGLFFEFARMKKETDPAFFLLENVKMLKTWENAISREMGCDPVEIDSSLVTAQSRVRLYWSNLHIEQPVDLGVSIDSIVPGARGASKRNRRCRYGKRTYTDLRSDGKVTTLLSSRFFDKENLVQVDGSIRPLTCDECEQLQTLPVGYTEGLSVANRHKLIGNGFTVDVVAHILRAINLGKKRRFDFAQPSLFEGLQ